MSETTALLYGAMAWYLWRALARRPEPHAAR
jgi:hypothetical protein